MIKLNNVIDDFKAKRISLEDANDVLQECGIKLDEKGKVICPDVSKINGIALLNSGTGTMNETRVKDGALVDDMGTMDVEVIIGNLVFKTEDQKLVLIK